MAKENPTITIQSAEDQRPTRDPQPTRRRGRRTTRLVLPTVLLATAIPLAACGDNGNCAGMTAEYTATDGTVLRPNPSKDCGYSPTILTALPTTESATPTTSASSAPPSTTEEPENPMRDRAAAARRFGVSESDLGLPAEDGPDFGFQVLSGSPIVRPNDCVDFVFVHSDADAVQHFTGIPSQGIHVVSRAGLAGTRVRILSGAPEGHGIPGPTGMTIYDRADGTAPDCAPTTSDDNN